jgi:hypothetical protein
MVKFRYLTDALQFISSIYTPVQYLLEAILFLKAVTI